ncbi:MAG: type II toxin-antitoxin system HicB family antitoxin [Dehalococcoidia bacterium]|nr:type II toxin-antitoxin system HicB family antitoxin [Dehalococcoidia bacterium]
MRYYSFAIVIEKEPEDPGYFAYSPTLPGCFSNGLTIEETRRNMFDAVQLHVESMIAHGETIPQGEGPVHVEELTLALPA